jgi:biopolymer transport protein ExbD
MAISAAAEGVNLGLIITPMLDMAFQLLAFFVMTYHPHATEGHIDGKLLPPTNVQPAGKKEKKDTFDAPVDRDPDAKDNLIVTIKGVAKGQTEGRHNEGEPTRILLKRPENAGQPDTIADTDIEWRTGLKKLRDELVRIHKSPSTSNVGVSIEADPDLHQQYVVQVYDVCKAAGFRTIGFVAPPLNVQGQ